MDVARDQLEAAVSAGIKSAFRDLGLPIDEEGEPYELRKDFIFLREQRLTCEQIRSKGILTLAGLFIIGLITLLVLGFKGWILQ